MSDRAFHAGEGGFWFLSQTLDFCEMGFELNFVMSILKSFPGVGKHQLQ